MKPVHPLILATTSSARRQMMENAGLSFHFQAPEVNEDAVRQANAGLDANSMAQLLADTKALSIIAQESIIIAADQTLEIDGAILTKTRSIAEARQQLIALRGQTHYLHSAVSCARDEKIIFRHTEKVAMTMRSFSDHFLETYLTQAGPGIFHSVGCYFYEARGIQLFYRVEGDYYSILGLPLLPLLAFLRKEAMIEA
jgi:septum formation protein